MATQDLSQVALVAQKVAPQNPSYPRGQNDPKVVFKTALSLDADQEKRLMDHALNRIENLSSELGRQKTSAANWYQQSIGDANLAAQGSFMGKRQLYELTYHNQLEWRRYLVGGIFEDSNLTVPLSRRIAQQHIARASNYFLGTDPWFSAYPVAASDTTPADLTDKYLKFKAQQSCLKDTVIAAIEGAIIRGEAVVKTIYKQDWTSYKSFSVVAVSGPGGNLLVASDGDYIFKGDIWVQGQDGRFTLKRDGKTTVDDPAKLVFENRLVERRKVNYKGAESRSVYYKDFVAPLDADSLQTADCVCHYYDLPAISVASLYASALAEMKGKTTGEMSSVIFESLQELISADGTKKSEAGKPRATLGERDQTATGSDGRKDDPNSEPIIEIAEIYIRFDADGDGVVEDIVMMVDKTNSRPLFYDYLANRTPGGKRPFDVVRVNKVEGRWHGVGTMEVFQPLQEVVDLLVNRWNASQSQSGNVVFWNPELTLEGEDNPNLELNGGNTYTPKGNIDPALILKVVPLYDIKGREIYKEIEFFMQVAINMSGVSHANDAAMLGMDTAKLATGVRNIERSGQEIFSIYLTVLQDGLESVLRTFTMFCLSYLDKTEAFLYTESEGAQKLEFGPENVSDEIDMVVRLEMTRYRNEQELAQATQASGKVIEFYTLPLELQGPLSYFYKQMLKAFNVPNVDQVIIPGQFQMPPASVGQNPAGGKEFTTSGMPGTATPNL